MWGNHSHPSGSGSSRGGALRSSTVPTGPLGCACGETNLVPLVTEGFSRKHGVSMGSIVGSWLTAAVEGTTACVRRDPFAMLLWLQHR